MAEVSPKASRGRYVAAQLSMLNLGIFLACMYLCSVVRSLTDAECRRLGRIRIHQLRYRLHSMADTRRPTVHLHRNYHHFVLLRSGIASLRPEPW